MKRIKKHKDYLLLLSKCPQKLRKIILKYGNENLLKAILEIVVNTLKGNVKLSKTTKEKLKKYKKALRQLCCPQLSINSKRQLLIQKGGFLNILLPSIIGGVLSHIFRE